MPYDEYLSERIQRVLKSKNIRFEDKKMFGGICYMIDNKMCVGVVKQELMARVNPEEFEGLLQKKGAKPMDFTKKPMKGYLFIEPLGVDNEADLEFWIEKCLSFNPIAKSSKK